VIYDLLGMNKEFKPKFVKRYAELGVQIPAAVARYKEEIASGEFPAEAQTFHADEPLFTPRGVPAKREESDVTELYGVPV
jgi:3-methyl-2-oxobutanoate hydroxymethyltransferase